MTALWFAIEEHKPDEDGKVRESPGVLFAIDVTGTDWYETFQHKESRTYGPLPKKHHVPGVCGFDPMNAAAPGLDRLARTAEPERGRGRPHSDRLKEELRDPLKHTYNRRRRVLFPDIDITTRRAAGITDSDSGAFTRSSSSDDCRTTAACRGGPLVTVSDYCRHAPRSVRTTHRDRGRSSRFPSRLLAGAPGPAATDSRFLSRGTAQGRSRRCSGPG